MANIMSMLKLRNKPTRDGFDLSRKVNFTAKIGELLPVVAVDVLAPDKFEIDLKGFSRTMPIATPAYARIREYYDWFFVPYSLLWNRANTVLSQMNNNPQHAVSIDPTAQLGLNGEMPYVTTEQIYSYINKMATERANNYFGYSRAELTAKLAQYLGYGTYDDAVTTVWNSNYANNLDMNIFRFLAYQKIYADFYRDSQWEKISPSTFNIDYMSGVDSMNVNISTAVEAFYENYNFMDLRYCNWQRDLFHGVLPHAQYGSPAVVPLDSFDVNHLLLKDAASSSSYTGTLTTSVVGGLQKTSDGSFVDVGSGSVTSFSGGFSVLALRQYEFLQKWKEIAQSAPQDYKSQMEAHWNVSIPDAYSEMSNYLGGFSTIIDIGEVVNTNLSDDNAATLAGKGISVNNGKVTFDANGRYGVLMCIYHAVPLLDYTTSFVDPLVTKINAEDFAIPEFDRIGMQPVYLHNLMNNTNGDFPLGYAPRYIEYKTAFDYSLGGFRKGLSNWIMKFGDEEVQAALSRRDSNNEVIFPSVDDGVVTNYTFFKVNPNVVDPLFTPQADSSVDTDVILASTYFDIKAVRALDRDGLPY